MAWEAKDERDVKKDNGKDQTWQTCLRTFQSSYQTTTDEQITFNNIVVSNICS